MTRINRYITAFLLLSSALYAQKTATIQSFRRAEAEAKERVAKQLINPTVQATQNQKTFDVTYYDISLKLDPSTNHLLGSVFSSMSIVDETAVVEWDLVSAYQVDSVLVNGAKSQFTHGKNILAIDLGQTYSPGEEVSTTVYYQGFPNNTGYRAFRFDLMMGQPMIWSLSEPYGARTWWPCKDYPYDKADSVDIRLTVPSDLTAASNGTLLEKNTDGDWTTWWWHEKYPIVTYLVSVAIHPYDYHEDHYLYNNDADTMNIEFYTFGNNWNTYKDHNLKVKDMIAAFADLFGEYPFVEEKYGHADFLGGGAMEHQTCSSFSFWGEEVYAHELAHQWWGNLITCESFHHIWLNEGFATYCEALWYEYAYGRSRYKQAMQSTAYYGPGTIFVEDPQNDNIFSGSLSYNKANWVLHMLRHVMGDSTFFHFLREYYQTFAYSTINTTQFKNLAEEVSGKELDNFFDQWIYGSGFPQYEFISDFQELENGLYKVSGIIYQKQPNLFDMPVDINVHMIRADTTLVVQVAEREVYFEATVSKKPLRIELDEDDWILKQVEKISAPQLTLHDAAISDSSGNADGTWDPGEEIDLYVTVKNQGVGVSDLQVAISTQDQDVTITKGVAVIDHVSFFTTSSNHSEALRIKSSPDSKHHVVELTVTVRKNREILLTDTFYLNLGRPRILIVDDDAGADYETWYKRMFGAAGILALVWNLEESGLPGLDELSKYMGVCWFTGDDMETTLTPDEQQLLSVYLAGGGKLLLSGQNIARDLSRDSARFLSDVLKASYVSHQTQTSPVFGVEGDPVGNGLVGIFDNTYPSANNQAGFTIIEPVGDAVVSFQFSNGLAAGIRNEDSEHNSKLVFFSFALEGIGSPDANTAAQFVYQAIVWLIGSTDLSNPPATLLPSDFVLNQNFPNPFNPRTTIRYAVPSPDYVRVIIYNTMGQKVKVIFEGEQSPGWHTLEWDGTDETGTQVTSGLYIMELRAGNGFRQSIKMVKVL